MDQSSVNVDANIELKNPTSDSALKFSFISYENKLK